MRYWPFIALAGCGAPQTTAPTTVDVQPTPSATPIVEPAPDVAKPTTGFDADAAAKALANADYQVCIGPNAQQPSIEGHVVVTFEPSGRVASSVVDRPPFAGTALGMCIAQAYGTIHIPPFSGSPVRVATRFTVP